jgi:hypothetical protein
MSPDLVLSSRSRSPRLGLTHLTFQPAYRGIAFFDAEVQVHVDDQGQIWRLTRPWTFLPIPLTDEPRLPSRDALRVALEALLGEHDPPLAVAETGSGPTQTAVFRSPALVSPAAVSLTWFVIEQETLPAWQMYVDPGGGLAYWVVVDALDGRLLFSRNLVHQERPEGLVFRAADRASPLKGPQTTESFAGWPASHGDCPAEVYPEQFRSGPEQQRCWVEGQQTRGNEQTLGNNADVCLDADGDNLCDRRALAAQGRFAFPFRDSFDRENDAAADRDAALTNAFYWANSLHDWLYRLGFDEAAGNFQADNFGRGGAAGDAVRIDLQDPAALNNATFTAAPDGIASRMELGLFAGLRRDSAFDADILTHEYVHGLTIRLIGGPASANGLSLWQSGAMGEGWSDAYAASFTGDPVVGEYSSRNSATGVRTVAYDQSPYTFGRFGTLRPTVIANSGGLLLGLPQVHRDGEIWATVLWDLRQALGRDDFEHLLTAALHLTPRRPSMLDARDAILQAAQAGGLGGANQCGVWAVFAARGFGFSAALNPVQDGQANDTALSVFESFDVPASCGAPLVPSGSPLLEEGAESAATSWTAAGQWRRTSRRSASGAFSWWYGQEAEGSYQTGARNRGSLTSPPIDLTGATGATVQWDQFLRTEGFNRPMDLGGTFGPFLNADSGRLMVSSDDGSSWWVVTHLAHPTPGNGFVRYRVNLSRFAGQTISLRFDFDTFDSLENDHEGWYLDNIRVFRLGPEPLRLAADPPALSFFATSGGPPAQTVTLSAQAGAEAERLPWTARVTQGASWLNLLPASGLTPSSVQISVAPLGLNPGVHRGTVLFQAVQQPALTTTIIVTMTIEAPGPLAAWSFDEEGRGPGITLADDSAGNHHGVTFGPGTLHVAGVRGNARIFDGATSFAAVPPSVEFSGPRVTLRTWIKLEEYPSALGIVASTLDPETQQGWLLGVLETGNLVLLVRGPKAPGPVGELLWLVSRRALAPREWRAVTVSLDQAGGAAALYLDGQLEATASFSGYTPQAAPLTFGRASWWDGYHLRFAIDETSLVGDVWTAAQVQADLAPFSRPASDAPATAVAHWRLGGLGAEATGILHDYSSSNNEAALHGSGLSQVSGIGGSALLFGGADYASVAPHDDFASPSFTFSAWIQLDAYPRDWGVLFSNFDGDYRGWFAGVRSDGRLILSIWGRPSFSSWVVSEGRLEIGRWHHVALSVDDLSQRAVFYIDGKRDRSFRPAGFTPQTTSPLTMARASWFGGYYLRFALDEAKVFGVALRAYEIQREFEQRASALAPVLAPTRSFRVLGR